MPPTYTTPSGELHLSKEAFNRFCERCDSMFKSVSDGCERAKNLPGRFTYYSDEVPFGSWNELLNSASKGDCHFCCSIAAQALMSERTRLVTGQGLQVAEHSYYPSLQPVVSEKGLLKMEIKPAIDISAAGGVKDLILRRQMHYQTNYEFITFDLDIIGEDGKPIGLVGTPGMFIFKKLPANLVRDFPASLNTRSEASLNQALRWVENCVSNHPSCHKDVHEKLQGQYLARFIDVRSVGSLTARIRETTGMNFREQRYATLSHCWGGSVPTQLLLGNYDSRLKGFALAELPRTFQDAILITRKFNVQFLWIDSLCIIQDSPDDWAAESAHMCYVYQNSFLNLAAAVSPNPSGGLFYQRYPLSFVPWAIALSENITLPGYYFDEKDNFTLNTRGWVLQEQILARRTLIFEKQELYWECSMGEASECFPEPINPFEKNSLEARERVPITKWRRSLPQLNSLSRGELLNDSQRHKVWRLLVKEYSGRKLTKQSDKLAAISGLAEKLSNGWNGITYLAGLWSYCLRQSLLWTCNEVQKSKVCNTDVAPSWSWASLSVGCDLYSSTSATLVDSLAEVLEAMVSPFTPTHLFGQVLSGGTVRIKGPLLRAIVRYDNNLSSGTGWVIDLDKECADSFGNQPNLIPSREHEGILDLNYMDWDMDVKGTGDVASAQPTIIYLAPLEIVHAYSKVYRLEGLLLRPMLTSSVRKGRFERLGRFTSYQNIERPTPKFHTTDELFPQLTGGSEEERMSLLRSDPYLNGPLNTKLKHRYSPELEPEEYPILGKFLECFELAAQHNRESDNPDENLGQDEGNGFYLYDLV